MTPFFPHPRNDRGYRGWTFCAMAVRQADGVVVFPYFFGGAGNNA